MKKKFFIILVTGIGAFLGILFFPIDFDIPCNDQITIMKDCTAIDNLYHVIITKNSLEIIDSKNHIVTDDYQFQRILDDCNMEELPDGGIHTLLAMEFRNDTHYIDNYDCDWVLVD